MKNLLLLSLILFGCVKQTKEVPRGFGGEGNPDTDYRTELLRTGGKDSDKDGIPNNRDKCPYVYAKTLSGCPDTVVKPPVDTVTPPPAVVYPASFSLPYLPPVINQGSKGACNSFNTGYYARAAAHYKKTGQQIRFAPDFIYYYAEVDTSINCTGSGLITNMNLLVEKGICVWDLWPYSWLTPCETPPTAEQTANALTYRITGYEKILITDSAALKKALLEGHALPIQVSVDYPFYTATAGFIWKVHTPPTLAAHGIAIVGWDDSKHAFKVVNQWGTAWGDEGYSWIDYDLMKTVSSSAFKIIL